jgi:hypothetical protein
MTVLVGILCDDGVVLGADRAETSMHGVSLSTVESPTAIKIRIIGSAVLTATTGAVGLGQRFNELMMDLSARGQLQMPGPKVMLQATHICNLALKDFSRTMSMLQQQPDRGWGLGALVAMPLNDRPELFEFDHVQFHPERKGDPDEHNRDRTSRFVSMGSGQLIADPFLGFIRRVFWMTDKPRLSDAKLAVAWTLRQVIALNPGGIGGAPHICSLEKVSDNWVARELSADEFMEQVNEVELHIGRYREELLKKLTQPAVAPKAPTVPSSAPQSTNGSPTASAG